MTPNTLPPTIHAVEDIASKLNIFISPFALYIDDSNIKQELKPTKCCICHLNVVMKKIYSI